MPLLPKPLLIERISVFSLKNTGKSGNLGGNHLKNAYFEGFRQCVCQKP